MEISIWWLLPALMLGASIGLLAGVLCLCAGNVSRDIEAEEHKHIDTHA